MKHFFILLVVLSLISCGSTRVDYDYDEEVNFNTYKTYNYMPDMQSGLSQLDLNRLMDAVDVIMQQKGFQKVEKPDLLINIIASQYREEPQNSVGIGVGGGTYGTGVSVGAGIPLGGSKEHQTITFDLVEAARDMLVWQAVSDSNIALNTNPQDRVSYYTKLAQKVFEGFPPQRD
ncbi:DUF4136 domain-containing protein [Leeuwenhoekiella nanhaiensis]|uniref:DUF4136 domain-containing protein n=1 Tax=Leeuwenhoekiella nanhaiensis TaxID=1655491 RepID=A0A2G1VRP6_9FLAO|nr:DUF4136 domain-containing protein [Leeuwenhoekiella nanhaiensis]PHQ29452.1 hypothetical protein CJ305_09025 [Leeuwenhoekiella nanhaiensis]